ncbi:MAG: terminase large subunit domain-containing protein, partial [Candidatus Binataceae bacterium]
MIYQPRRHQLEIHDALKRFSVLVCHRRFGKTVLAINQLIQSASRSEKEMPRFAYLAPLRNQAKAVAWDLLLHYSAPIRAEVNISELRVELVNGARVSLFGADNPDALRGLHLDGAVLDEYAQMAPRTWTEVIRPALADRKGWAIFIGTPKGRNGFFTLYEAAKNDPEWYAAVFKASATGVVEPDELARLKAAMPEEEYAQEFECSFAAANAGAYYGREMTAAEAEGRIARVPWEPTLPVTTAWDLGIDDATAIWFVQAAGREIRVIDYYESSGAALSHYAAVLRNKPYVYGQHLLPHDASVKELGTGLSRIEVLQSLGLNPTVVPAQRVEDGINAVRVMLPRCWFDAEKCARGINCLREYAREWVDKLETWRASPRHD